MNNTMDLDKKQKTPSARGILILGILAGLFLIPSILGAASDAILSLLYVILGIMNFNLDTLLNIILPEGFWLIVTLLEIFLFLILGVICFSNRKPRWLVAPLGALTLTLGVKIIFPILNSYLHGFHFTIGNFFDLFCRNYSITLLPIVLLSVIALLNTTGKKASWKKVAGILPPLVFVFSNLLCLVFIIVFFNRYRHLLELSQFLGNLGTFRYLCNRIFPSPIDKIVCFLPRLTLDLFNGIFRLLPDFIFVVLQFVMEVISWATSWILPFSLWVVLDKKSKKEVKAKKETEKKDHPTEEDSPAEAEKAAEMEAITNEQEAVPVSQKDETPTTASNPPRHEEIRVADIKSYKELLDMGAITQEEYDAKKKQLLDL